jgi:hypothetical protein
MIEQQDLPEYIERSLPELSGICKNADCKNPYDIARQMIRYTADQLRSKNLLAAKKCLTMADNLYNTGNKVIRNAIENVFVYSFSHTFFHDEAKRQSLLALLPANLYTIYKRQMVAGSHL